MTQTSPHYVPGLSLTPEQIERRRSSIGASDMPAVVGLSKYRSPLALYAEKRGLIAPSFEGNEFTEWGTRLEGVVADAYAEKQSVGVERVETLVTAEGWRSATPDRKVYDLACHQNGPAVFPWLRGLEVKCRGDYSAIDFGDEGTDQVPDEVAIQCHTTMSVMRALPTPIIVDRWDVATLIGGNRFRHFVLYYDAAIDAGLTEAAHHFWHNYVLAGVEPPIDASEATSEYLRERFRQTTETILQATPETDAMIRELRNVRAQKTDIEAAENGIKNRLMGVIGDNAGIVGPSGKISWKAPNGNTVSWKSVAEAMGAPASLIAQHSTPMSRRFIPTFPKQAK